MKASPRIHELDLMRGFAMVLILLLHGSEYVPRHPVPIYAQHGLGVASLGMFAFLTGFGLAESDREAGWTSWIDYARRRFWRVYVPYVAALAVFVGLFGVLRLDPVLRLAPWSVTIPIHLACLQVVMFPRFRQCFTLWYVGLLLLMYAVYPLLRRMKTARGFLLAAGALLLGALAVRQQFHLIDVRLFLYAPVFFAGILASRTGVVPGLLAKWPPFLGSLSSLLFAALYALFMRLWGGAVIRDRWVGDLSSFFIAPIAVSWGLILLTLVAGLGCARFIRSAPRCRVVVRAAEVLSAGAFFIYLFHRPALAAWTSFADHILHLAPPLKIALLPLVVAGTVAACAAAERSYTAWSAGRQGVRAVSRHA